MIAEFDKVSFSYEQQHKVLDELKFSIERGESVGLIGSNGAGKSTILKLLVGLFSPESGQIRIDGLTVEKQNLAAVRKKAGFVFQDADSQLFMPTVYEDIAFGPENYGLQGDALKQKVNQVMEALGIESLSGRRTTRLSGGEKKMVSIATALALEPEMLIFDEPSIALDPGNRRKLIGILQQLPMARLIATHDLDLVLDVCDRVMVLHRGVIIADGNAQEILQDENLLQTAGLELPLCLQGRMV